MEKDTDFKTLSLTRELREDEFYSLYARSLKERNGERKYARQRKKLIDIYSNLNFLFSYLQYGGTYFGHQMSRILGDAEYSVYLYIQNENALHKSYDLAKQKALYIQSLRQLIQQENEPGLYHSAQERINRSKELNRIVDAIEREITENFYLRRAQEFQYEYYEYYHKEYCE